MDRISIERRRANMRRIRSEDTAPELIVRRLLRQLRVGYRLHVGDLPGRPDIVVRRRKVAIFVHGCFWHRHEGCARAFAPATRADWWKQKLDRNVERDARAREMLNNLGWRVCVMVVSRGW